MALDAGAPDIARKVPDAALDHLTDLERLESALAIAMEIGSQQLQTRSASRLEAAFSDSRALRDFRGRRLLSNRDYRGLAALYADDADASALYATAADHFAAESRRTARSSSLPRTMANATPFANCASATPSAAIYSTTP